MRLRTLVSVGEEYPIFKNGTEKMANRDGGILEAFEEGEGLWFHLYLKNPNQKEIEIFRKEKISVRLVQDDNFVLPVVRFGNTMMIFEMSFDPTLYKDVRAFQISEINNLLTMVLIDSSNGIVKALRQANLPLKFIQIAKEKWARAFLEVGYSEKYKKWYEKLKQIPLEKVWDRALYVGKLGETYNLEEVHYHYDSNFYH
jgi:hypothetical protein